MNIISRAVQPLRRLVKSDFDFSNMDDFQYDDEYDEEGKKRMEFARSHQVYTWQP